MYVPTLLYVLFLQGRESANSKANTGTGTGTIVDKSTEYFSGYASYNMHESETNL